MGHAIFIVLHLAAFLVIGWVWLLLTVPLHVIYSSVAKKGTSGRHDEPQPFTHVRCHECKELVWHDATKCKHCGATLTPVEDPQAAEFERQRRILEDMKPPDRRYP